MLGLERCVGEDIGSEPGPARVSTIVLLFGDTPLVRQFAVRDVAPVRRNPERVAEGGAWTKTPHSPRACTDRLAELVQAAEDLREAAGLRIEDVIGEGLGRRREQWAVVLLGPRPADAAAITEAERPVEAVKRVRLGK